MTVKVTLTADDRISSVIDSIANKIRSLGSLPGLNLGLNGVSSGMSTINRQIGSASNLWSGFVGGIVSGGAIAGIQAITMAFGKLQAAMYSATRAETLTMAQAGNIAARLNISFDRARKMTEDIRSEISKIAADFPGENSDFTAIYQQVTSSVVAAAEGSEKRVREAIKELTKRFGILAAIRGANASMAGSALNRAIAGTLTIGGMTQLEIFEKNPEVLQSIRDQMEALGKDVKEWRSLNTRLRLEILKKAGRFGVSDETILAFEDTTEAIFQGMKTRLFDENTGVFGLLRRIPELGNRNVVEATATFLKSFEQLTTRISKLAKAAGFDFDPMAGLIKLIDWFTNLNYRITGILNSGGDMSPFRDLASSFSQGFMNLLNGTIDFLENGLGKVNFKEVGKNIMFTITRFLWDLILKTDYNSLAGIVLELLFAPFELLIGAIEGAFLGFISSITSWFSNIYSSIPGLFRPGLQNLNPINNAKNLLDAVNTLNPFRSDQTQSPVNNPTNAETTTITQPSPPPAQIRTPQPNQTNNTNTSSSNTYAPVVNVQASAGEDNESLAQRVMAVLDQQWNEYQGTLLA